MDVLLDGKRLFGGSVLSVEADTPERESIERSVAGLEGRLQIDLGGRGRRIVQRGVLEAFSRESLRGKVERIEGFIDGRERRLEAGRRVFESVVMVSFRAGVFQFSGRGVLCEYEILYRQSAGQ